MAAAAVMQPDRSSAYTLLQSDTLGAKFHQLFDTRLDDQARKKEKKKNKKKAKNKVKDKSKHKRENSPEKVDLQAPNIELHGNPSSFVVYAIVRQAVLEQQVKSVSQLHLLASQPHFSDSDSEDELDEKTKDGLHKMPKIVGIGLVGVFELIKETRQSHPQLCCRALQALLDMLQGQQPEGLKSEPQEVIDSLYQLLMELAMTPLSGDSQQSSPRCLTALACSCLLSLVIARGDTGKLLSAVSAALMSPAVLASQEVVVPGIMTSLQRSVQAVLLGKTHHPDWLSHGIRERARMDTFHIQQLPQCSNSESAVASDGRYLYIHNNQGLHKVGSGFGDTIKGHVYASQSGFHPKERGWIAFAKGLLFYKKLGESSANLTLINRETLKKKKVPTATLR